MLNNNFLYYTLICFFVFLVDIIILYVLTSFVGIYYFYSAVISFSLGAFLNYILSIRFIFKDSKLPNKILEFGIFLFIGIFGLIINQGILWMMTEIVGLYYIFSKIFSSMIIFLWNYFLRKKILF
ncbi:MAG: GtrA family protein [Candidatus Woesearchaeota archaeon]